MPDTFPLFFIRNMIPVVEVQKSSKASHFCSLYNSLYLCCKGLWYIRVQVDWNDQGTHDPDFGAEGNVLVFL